MSSSWPVGVTTLEDMKRYAKTLFGNCRIENLLKGTSFDGYSGCFLIRVKGACNNGDWKMWPDLIERATAASQFQSRTQALFKAQAKRRRQSEFAYTRGAKGNVRGNGLTKRSSRYPKRFCKLILQCHGVGP